VNVLTDDDAHQPRPLRPEADRMAPVARLEADPGSAFVTAATVALAVQAAGLLYVSFAAQYAFILSEKPGQRAASVIEALMLDTGMIIFSFLALGLAKKGLPARTERALIMVCAGLSAAMNYAASHTGSWRSVAVYVIAPVFLAVVTDRVIAGVRRHVLGLTDKSAWATLGRALARTAQLAGMALLYLLRFVLAPPSTAAGLRRWLLAATPLPEAQHKSEPAARQPARAGGIETKPDGPPELEAAADASALPDLETLAEDLREAIQGALDYYADELAAGRAPSARQIQRDRGHGQARAAKIWPYLNAEAERVRGQRGEDEDAA
jgi:hypothetical protein